MEDLKKIYIQGLIPRVDSLKTQLEELKKDFTVAGESIRRLAHSLYGSGATYGFPRISEAARKTEVAPDNAGYHLKYARILITLRKYSQARSALIKAQDLGADKNQVSLLIEQIQRIQSPVSWEAGIALDYQTFSTDNKSDWWGTIEYVKKEFTG